MGDAQEAPNLSSLFSGFGRRGFIEHTIVGMLDAMEYALTAEDIAHAGGLLQKIDPRAKLIGLMSMVIASSASTKLPVIACIMVAALAMAALSRIPMALLVKRGWTGPLLFTGAIALPALFLTPGTAAFTLPVLGWTGTSQGLTAAAFLMARVLTAVTLSLLLVLCTPWVHVLKALRVLGIPPAAVVILGMTYRYIFLLLRSAREMLEARSSRLVGSLEPREARRLAAGGMAVLLGKTLELSGEVHLAMVSRGFRGEFHSIDEFRMRPADWAALAAMLALSAAAIFIGG